jgi:hypothetical protein
MLFSPLRALFRANEHDAYAGQEYASDRQDAPTSLARYERVDYDLSLETLETCNALDEALLADGDAVEIFISRDSDLDDEFAANRARQNAPVARLDAELAATEKLDLIHLWRDDDDDFDGDASTPNWRGDDFSSPRRASLDCGDAAAPHVVTPDDSPRAATPDGKTHATPAKADARARAGLLLSRQPRQPQDLEKLAQIGRGSFGEVWLVSLPHAAFGDRRLRRPMRAPLARARALSIHRRRACAAAAALYLL